MSIKHVLKSLQRRKKTKKILKPTPEQKQVIKDRPKRKITTNDSTLLHTKVCNNPARDMHYLQKEAKMGKGKIVMQVYS